ncbi:MAG TPA: hypothetical protein VG944_24910, partial [Fimbriimonas sp.]|nr:hypothetical protein [Fimbriimonas sp.]
MLAASILLLALHASPDPGFDPGPSPLLMRHPTVSKTTIVFQFAGDLWSVSRAGGEAVRLTAAQGTNSDPFFSPDGSMIAFSGQYDGNTDVFVMPAIGGVPTRLTAHPAPDEIRGWTPDGKSVIFSSSMLSNTDHPRLFSVPITGGFPKPYPFPAVVEASFSPDGKHMAYTSHQMWEQAWKRYRGGQTRSIFIGDLSDSRVKAVPRQNTDDHNPMWFGDSIYYLSDKRGPVGLYRYDTRSGSVSEEVKGEGFDLKSATAGPDVIVYERLGSINLFDPKSRASHSVKISIHGDFPQVRPELKDVRGNVNSIGISPTGQRAVLSARGWIFTAPVKKGDIRMLDGNQGVFRRDPAWSPDAKTIAFISDEGGHQQMALVDLETNKERHVPLGDPPAYYHDPVWSPDSKQIAYTDNRLTVWVLDVASGKNTKIDSGSYRGPSDIQPRWSPDSKWLTWNRDLMSHVDAVFLHSFDSGKNTQVTDGLAETSSPCFDRNGKYLYFLASTDVGQGIDYEDMSSMNSTNSTSSVYAVVLRKDLPNPLQPESDEETPKEEKKDDKKPDGHPVPMGVDLDGIEQRIISLPIPIGGYQRVEAGAEGCLFVLSFPPRATSTSAGGPGHLQQFKFADRKLSEFSQGVVAFRVSSDGKKVLLQGRGGTQIVDSATPASPSEGVIDLSGLRVKIDPRAEWNSMYHDVWATERLLFYDPHLHGIDSVEMEKRYEPFLKNVCTRDDLNYLFTDMLGEICVGHMFIGGGDRPFARSVPGGLLGADFVFDK